MALLKNSKQIFDLTDDLQHRDVEVPEWIVDGEPVTIRLRVLTGAERDRFEQSCTKMVRGQMIPDMINARARLVALTAIDESGNRVFRDDEVLKLGARSSKALDRLFTVAQELSGISDADIEKLEEGFGDGQSASSTSA